MVGYRFGAVAAALVSTFVLTAGCSSAPPRESIGSGSAAVQGGTTDTTHPYAVGVCVGGPNQCQLICSGALIAPNLVLTARHCVDQTPQAIDCNSSSTVFGGQHAPTQYFYITTDYTMWQSNKGWHQASKIYTTPGTKICGNDMALIELSDNVPSSEASLVTPVVQYSITDHPRYSTTVTAIGYGMDSPTDQNSAGTRRIRQNINLQCIPGDSTIDCGNLSGAQMTANEFLSGDGTCEGDSGSSAYEQKYFNANTPVSFGVLSRGGSDSTTCIGGIYTRTDSWKSFIVSTALQAASDGGYPAPAWTQAAPPPPTDGGSTQPGSGQLGDPCGDGTDCASGQCQSQSSGSAPICTQACDNAGNSCPSGYSCSNGYCFPSSGADGGSGNGGNGGNGQQIITTTKGCSVDVVGPDPTKPVPWRAGAIAGLVALAIIRRRRSSVQ